MTAEIRQPRHIDQVQPPNRARDTGPRKQPRKPPAKEHGDKRAPASDDGKPHQVDEYV